MMPKAMGRHSYQGVGSITAAVTIGNFTSVAPGVQMHPRIQHPCADDPLLVSTASMQNLRFYPKARSADGIAIGHDVWIGMNAVLLAPLTIGHGAIVGAYSVVAKDVPPYAVVVGNPARVIRYRFDAPTINALLDIAWWDWPDELIDERAADLRDVNALVAKYAYGVYGQAD